MRFSKMTVDEGTLDAQAEHEAARVVVEDAWLPTDVLWSEAELDPTWRARQAVQNLGLVRPQGQVDIYEGYDAREPFID